MSKYEYIIKSDKPLDELSNLEGVISVVQLGDHGPLADLNSINSSFEHAISMCTATHKSDRADYWSDAKAMIREAQVIIEANNTEE